LDIGLTLEYLETEGVAVVGYNTTDFPAFFTPKSGFFCSARLNTTLQIARVIGMLLFYVILFVFVYFICFICLFFLYEVNEDRSSFFWVLCFFLATNSKLRLKKGMIIANPIPEEEAANALLIEEAVQTAVRESK
jgi:pseudouridine-5'-phosphate glycosidase